MIKYEVKELFCMIETSPNMKKRYKEGWSLLFCNFSNLIDITTWIIIFIFLHYKAIIDQRL